MRVLVVYCHPRSDSFCSALRDNAVAALQAAGHHVEICDLYGEAFAPVLTAEQHARYYDETMNLRGAEEHAAALRGADALLLVYPTWWFGMPAMLKGWLDRVWVPGVAFRLGSPLVLRPLLANIRRIGVITTYGSPRWLLWWVSWPDRRIVRRGIRPLCARHCRLEWLSLTGMDTRTAAERTRFIGKVRARLGRWR